jgi:uncharacterized protein (DUF433 family)
MHRTLPNQILIRSLRVLYYSNCLRFPMSTTTRIVKTPDVLHGKPRIEGTRIGVLQIGTQIRQQDLSIKDVAAQFDLDTAQVEAALEYYDEHPELMETLRAQHKAGLASIEDESRAT